jgi:Fic family protein
LAHVLIAVVVVLLALELATQSADWAGGSSAAFSSSSSSSSPSPSSVLSSLDDFAQGVLWRVQFEYRRYYDSMLGVPCASLWPFKYAHRFRYTTPSPDYTAIRQLAYARRIGEAHRLCSSGQEWLRYATGMFIVPQPPLVDTVARTIEDAQSTINRLRTDYAVQRWPPQANNSSKSAKSSNPAASRVHAALKRYAPSFVARFTYSSNKIEGSALTLLETKEVLKHQRRGHQYIHLVSPQHETNAREAVDHADAWKWMMAERVSKKVPLWQLQESHIRQLQFLVTRQTLDPTTSAGGEYRTTAMHVDNRALIAPQGQEVPELMRKLVEWLASLETELRETAFRYAQPSSVVVDPETVASQDPFHPVTIAALLHLFFVNIHPFFDGNGRTARLLFNYALLALNYPLPVNIPSEPSEELDAYMAALQHFSTTMFPDAFIAFMHRAARNEAQQLLDELDEATRQP